MYHLHSFRRRNQRSRDEQQQIYDDKDRETFGDDFVADHQKHENPLMMPGMAISKLLVFGDFSRTHYRTPHVCDCSKLVPILHFRTRSAARDRTQTPAHVH